MQEKELIKLAREGDTKAYADLIENYTNLVSRIARRYFLIGGEMDDLVQEGLIGLCGAIKTYNLSSDVAFKSFAYLCINNAIKTVLTKSNRQKNSMLNNYLSVDEQNEDEDSWAVILISDELSPEDEMIKKQKIKAIVKEINNILDTKQKIIFNMYLNNYKYTEIASSIGKDVKYIDNTLTQIKKKLAHLKEKEDL